MLPENSPEVRKQKEGWGQRAIQLAGPTLLVGRKSEDLLESVLDA